MLVIEDSRSVHMQYIYLLSSKNLLALKIARNKVQQTIKDVQRSSVLKEVKRFNWLQVLKMFVKWTEALKSYSTILENDLLSKVMYSQKKKSKLIHGLLHRSLLSSEHLVYRSSNFSGVPSNHELDSVVEDWLLFLCQRTMSWCHTTWSGQNSKSARLLPLYFPTEHTLCQNSHSIHI